jgi:hypothetical protein
VSDRSVGILIFKVQQYILQCGNYIPRDSISNIYFGGLFETDIFFTVKANVRRVQIALALAVIKSRPEGITAVQHAVNIQACCRIKYSNCVRL